MTTMLRYWLHSYSGWIAAGFLALGSFGIGYGVAMLQGRQDAVLRVQNVSAGYKEALLSKDRLISQLVGSTVRATAQAADATDAAATATDAAAVSIQNAANAAQKKTATDTKALRKLK